MALSRREREILAQIEDEFTPKETDRAAALNAGPARRLQYSTALRTWLGLLALLAVGLAMIPLGVVLLGIGPVGLGVLTAAVVVPWTVLAATRLTGGKTGA